MLKLPLYRCLHILKVSHCQFLICLPERNVSMNFYHNVYFKTNVHCVLKNENNVHIPVTIEIMEDTSYAYCVMNNGGGRLDTGRKNFIFISEESPMDFRFSNVNIQVAVQVLNEELHDELMSTCSFLIHTRPSGGVDECSHVDRPLVCDDGENNLSAPLQTSLANLLILCISLLIVL